MIVNSFFFSIDGDGQNNPNDFIKFIDYINNDYDLIYGIRLKEKILILKKFHQKLHI